MGVLNILKEQALPALHSAGKAGLQAGKRGAGALSAFLGRLLEKLPFVQARGIRRRWLLSSVSFLVAILAIMVITFAVVMHNYYDSDVRSDLESAVTTTSFSCFSIYAGGTPEEERLDVARDYVSKFQHESTEMQLLSPEGHVLTASNALTIPGAIPETQEIDQARESGSLACWEGRCAPYGRVIAATTPLLFDGTLYGFIRCVAPMRMVDQHVLMLTLAAVALAAGVLVLVYLSNIYFVRSIVVPVENITAIAQRIATGSYGIQLEKKFDDEIGDLTDAINDMSTRIKQAESMKSEFISSVSHELRTPLTAITGWAETIMGGEARDEGDVRKGMGIIASEARRLSGMVEELLEFSRIEDGRFTLSVEPMDIKAELEDAVYTYHEFLAGEGISVCHEDCEEEFGPIPGDPDRLRQVFCNLLDNAAKHGGSGKRIDTAIYPDGSDVVITVRDYGPGIPPEELPNVKYKFYKGSATARGSGIGLAVCDEIVSRHNGELNILNAEDELGGCVAEIRLPTGTGT